MTAKTKISNEILDVKLRIKSVHDFYITLVGSNKELDHRVLVVAQPHEMVYAAFTNGITLRELLLIHEYDIFPNQGVSYFIGTIPKRWKYSNIEAEKKITYITGDLAVSDFKHIYNLI